MSEILTGLEVHNYTVKSFTIKYACKAPLPKKDLLTSPARVMAAVQGIFNELDGGPTVEHFGVLFLNVQNELIGFKAFNTGTIDAVAVYPRMIIHTALMVGAAGLILVHNHPSGYSDPSEEDRRLTRSMIEASKVFDLRIMDHLIIGDGSKYFSFAERGLI